MVYLPDSPEKPKTTHKETINTRHAIKLNKKRFYSNSGLEEKHLDKICKITQNSPESSCGASYK